MDATIGGKLAQATVEFTAKFTLALEPGIWVVSQDEQTYSIVALQGLIGMDGHLHVSYPKGVPQRPNGTWAAKDKLLAGALPRAHPSQTWDAMPARVRELIEDTYLLTRDATPDAIG